MEFSKFKNAIAKQFELMSKHELFRTTVEKDDLWTTYLSSFPAGSNPIYRERTEHDCSCCKSFIKAVGDVVAIVDDKLVSLWDITVDDPAYQAVTDALAKFVKAQPIDKFFLHAERTAGVDKNFEQLVEGVKTWNHFFINIPAKFINKDPGAKLGELRATHDVFSRSLQEISFEAIDTVLELIAQNSLYRGEEHKFAVTEFRKLKVLSTTNSCDKDLFVWNHAKQTNTSITRIRNTSIGTLLIDLSEGKELEYAVKSFESKVAPTNYKRPTALVTKAMIENAKTKIEELGLTSALERRYATIDDITINNVLFANRDAKKSMTGNVFDDLASTIPNKKKKLDKVEEISIDKFLSDILPGAKSIALMIEGKHTNNLVSLIAPVDPTARKMFKWDNRFSWSYNGELADSEIRKAVQARGGRVDGVFRFSHSWNHPGQRNSSLMDLHVFMPGHNNATEKNGINDFYGNNERVGWNNRNHHKSGGVQDVDYTPAAPKGYIPVENITFPELKRMPEGRYICKIHNWENRNYAKGFKAEIEFGGEVFQYEYTESLKHKEWVTVAVVTLKNGVFSIEHHLQPGSSSRALWGINTNTFVPVNVVMLSPNYWDGMGVGNRHYFFMLDGCLNDGKARGFFNEFLVQELDAHRKVVEMVGAKMRTEESEKQLSGLGFSSTQNNSVLCRVTGTFSRVIKIIF